MIKRFGIITALVAAVALLAAVACGGNETGALPTQPPPTETPVKGPPPLEEPKTIEAPAPIEDTAVVPPATWGGEYILKITSGLPSGCAQFNEFRVERRGNGFEVAVTNLMPADPMTACTMIYGYHDGEVVLGSGLDAGGTYTVTINGDLAISFTVQDEMGMAMVEKKSPIENVEVTEAGDGYLLTVISTLPKGSSCSRFNGYEINRRFAERVEVTVTHMEVPPDYVLPCTADLPSVVTEIPLGGDFDGGRTYTVSVNGTEATFPEVVDAQAGDSAPDEDATAGTPSPIEHATVEVQAPVEGSSIAPPETPDGPYIIKITSGLPNGCARFNAYHLSWRGNDFSVEVTNRMPADEMVICTMIYGYYEGEGTLGDSPLISGETYTVTINGQLAHTFTAR